MASRLGLRAVLMAGVAAVVWPSTSRALDAIDFNLAASASSAAAAQSADDEDEDAFFSGRYKVQDTTASVATVGRLPRSALIPRPTVDIVATCRAVLADNLNYYNHNFIEGCQRTVRTGSPR